MTPGIADRRVVITRPAHQTAGLAAAFRRAGFVVELLPLLEVVPPEDPTALDEAMARLTDFDGVVLTSANAVPPLTERLDGSWPREVWIATVGSATTRRVRAAGWRVDFEAQDPQAQGLVTELGPQAPGARLLLPQAADARSTLARGLEEAGADVTVAVAYDKRLPPDSLAEARRLFTIGDPGWITVTSPRIGRHLVELLREVRGDAVWESRKDELRLVSIGPVTSRALRRLDLEPAAEAAEPSDQGLVEAVLAAGAETRTPSAP